MGILDEKMLGLYQLICDNYQSNAEDIFCSMEFLIESVSNSKNAILQSIQNEKDFDRIFELTEYGKYVEKIEKTLNTYLDAFASMSASECTDVEDENLESEKTIPNYKDYEVDPEIPHLLTESFTYKKICGFFLNNVRYNVSEWKTTLIKICELLYDKDSVLFEKIIFSEKFVGKKIEYFSRTHKAKHYHKLKNANIYVWTQHNANTICSLIRRLLREYNIPANSLYIYLRADYTPLHNASVKNDAITISNENEEIKIGKFVKMTMRNLSVSGYTFDEQTLNILLDDDETKKTFGIGTSFLKEVRDEAQLSRLVKDAKGYNRYWREIFEFNGKKFIIVSQWTKHNADRFKRWFNGLPNTERIVAR